ncbi:hypothetical protein [Nonomuraea roseola]|uniref:hypothetical protein n=1 Tax=Nonomuraea roseola TaxID=46179 RepID=UPI0031F7FABF
MAHLLDNHVLLHLANASILTGIMLSAMTRWGFFRYWWVLTKFAITMSQLYAAVFLLSPRLTALAEGVRGSDPALLFATALMASAIAFQGWLSVAKPWKRTPWAEARLDVPPAAPVGHLPRVAGACTGLATRRGRIRTRRAPVHHAYRNRLPHLASGQACQACLMTPGEMAVFDPGAASTGRGEGGFHRP